MKIAPDPYMLRKVPLLELPRLVAEGRGQRRVNLAKVHGRIFRLTSPLVVANVSHH